MIEPVGHARSLIETSFPEAGSRFARVRCVPRRRLPRHRLGSRWLAAREGEPGPVVVYLLRRPIVEDDLEAVEAALAPAAHFEHPHALRVAALDLVPGDGACLVTPYCGSSEGLLSLAQILPQKAGGRFDLVECRAALEQALSALSAAQDAGLAHGAVRMDEVLVDGRGRIVLELVGVERALQGETLPSRAAALARFEAASLVRVAYELVTGVTVGEPCTPAGKVLRGLPRAWDAWLAHGLDPAAGFDSAAEALARLPGW